MSYQKLMTESTFFGSSPFVKLVASSSVRGVMQSLQRRTPLWSLTHPRIQLNSTQPKSYLVNYVPWKCDMSGPFIKRRVYAGRTQQKQTNETWHLLLSSSPSSTMGINLVEVHCHEVGPNRGYRFLLFWLLTGNLTLENSTNLLLPPTCSNNVGQVKSSQVGSMTPDHHLVRFG